MELIEPSLSMVEPLLLIMMLEMVHLLHIMEEAVSLKRPAM